MTDNIKPVLTDYTIEAAFLTEVGKVDAKAPLPIYEFGRAIEREVLLATRDCRLCGNYATCNQDAEWFGELNVYADCINGSHYTPTEQPVHLWNKG